MFRSYKFYSYVVLLFVIMIVSISYLFLFNLGLDLTAKTNSSGNIDVTIYNNSSHIADKISLYNNGKVVESYPKLMPGESKTLSVNTNDSVNNLVLEGAKHVSVKKSINLSGDNTKGSANLNVSLTNSTFFRNSQNQISVNLCSSGGIYKVSVKMYSDSTFDIIGDDTKEVIVNNNSCESAVFELKPLDAKMNVRFKVYNDIYNREFDKVIDVK